MGVTYASGVDKGLENAVEMPEGVERTTNEQSLTKEPDMGIQNAAPEVWHSLWHHVSGFLAVQYDVDKKMVSPQATGEDLTNFARRIACQSTLSKLANLPPRSNVKIMQALDVTSESKVHQKDLALSSLELARQVGHHVVS